MSIFLDGPAAAISDMPPPVAAKAVVDWALGPRTRHSGLRLRAFEIVYFTQQNLGVRHPGVPIAIAEGIGWGQAHGLFCPDPSVAQADGSLITTRLAKRLFETGELGNWLPAAGLRKDDLHPVIASACWDSVCAAKHDVAVFEAFRALEEAARAAQPGYDGKSGADVFSRGFNKDSGPLRDPSIVDAGEHEAWRQLFVGAYGAFRNPPAHRSDTKSDIDAVREELMLASLLMRKLDQSRSRAAG